MKCSSGDRDTQQNLLETRGTLERSNTGSEAHLTLEKTGGIRPNSLRY